MTLFYTINILEDLLRVKKYAVFFRVVDWLSVLLYRKNVKN